MSALRLRDVRLIAGAVGLLGLRRPPAVGPARAPHRGDSPAPRSPSRCSSSRCSGRSWCSAASPGGSPTGTRTRGCCGRVSLAQAAVVGVMALATGSLAALLVLTALLGAGVALAQPAEFALVPVAAGEDRVAEANGLVETARYAGMTAGPLAAACWRRRDRWSSRCCSTPPRSSRSPPRPRDARAPRPAGGAGRGGRHAAARATASPSWPTTASLRVTLAAGVAALLFFSDLDRRRAVLRHRRPARRRRRATACSSPAGRSAWCRRRRARAGACRRRRWPPPRCWRSRSRAPGSPPRRPRASSRPRSPASRSAASRTASRTSCCARSSTSACRTRCAAAPSPPTTRRATPPSSARSAPAARSSGDRRPARARCSPASFRLRSDSPPCVLLTHSPSRRPAHVLNDA